MAFQPCIEWTPIKKKITSATLCKQICDINYSTFSSPFESGKCRKETKKLQKFEYLENENSILDDTKTFFIIFEGLLFDGKMKNSGHKL